MTNEMIFMCHIFFFHIFSFGVHGLRLSPTNDAQTNDDTCTIPKPPNYDYQQFADSSRYNLDELMEEMPFGDHTGILSVMDKLAAKKNVSLAVLGGSMTAGHKCQQHNPKFGKLNGKDCAWPRRLQRWMEAAFPGSSIRVSNLGQGVTTSSVILATVALLMSDEGFANADMIFLDTLINDASEAQSYSTAGKTLSYEKTVSGSYEQLVRSLHDLRPDVPIFSLLEGCPACKGVKKHQKQIAEHYNLPGLDISEMVEKVPVIFDAPGHYPQTHPTFRGHQAVADLIASSWANVWESNRGCKIGIALSSTSAKQAWPAQSFWDQSVLDSFPYCSKPVSVYTANDASNSLKPDVVTGDWKLYEDVPGKPGWIATQPESKITFPLAFGRHPRLALTWLRSYENLGKVRLALNNYTYTLDGLWKDTQDDKVSQSFTQWFHANSRIHQQERIGEEGLLGFSIAPNASQNITFELMNVRSVNKFKLISVLTC